jgi:hypothetical protein
MTKHRDQPDPSSENDLVWGARCIGVVINRTKGQVYTLHARGALKGAVRRIGHRTLVGSRRELAKLVSRETTQPAE